MSYRPRHLMTLAAAVLMAIASHGCGGDGDRRSGAASSSTTATAFVTTEPSADTPAGRGEQLARRYNCVSCHSTTGATLAGPTWKGLAGSTVKLSDGRTVVADHDYLVRSIVDPDAQIVDGYSRGIMSDVIRPGSIDRADADAIAAGT
jgi:cytochrome c551/c552